MFGNKSAFGSTGGFGQQQQQPTSVFGQQPQQQTSAFGGRLALKSDLRIMIKLKMA
jgi:hypothetical protein